MDGCNPSFLLGNPIFRGYVSFREGTHTHTKKNKRSLNLQIALPTCHWVPQVYPCIFSLCCLYLPWWRTSIEDGPKTNGAINWLNTTRLPFTVLLVPIFLVICNFPKDFPLDSTWSKKHTPWDWWNAIITHHRHVLATRDPPPTKKRIVNLKNATVTGRGFKLPEIQLGPNSGIISWLPTQI